MQFWARRWGLQWNLTCHHPVFKRQRVGENRFRPSQWSQGTTKRASMFWIILWELRGLTFEPGSTNHESHQNTVSEYHLRPWVEPRSLQEDNVGFINGCSSGSEDGVYNETSNVITRFLKGKGLEKTVLDLPNEARVPQKGHQCFESFCGNLGV